MCTGVCTQDGRLCDGACRPREEIEATIAASLKCCGDPGDCNTCGNVINKADNSRAFCPNCLEDGGW